MRSMFGASGSSIRAAAAVIIPADSFMHYSPWAEIVYSCHPERSEGPVWAGGAASAFGAPPAHTTPSVTLGMTFIMLTTLLLATAFSVGTATAAPGQKASGTIEVPAGVDAALSIPVVVAQGTRPGPVLALVSGAHGTEYASILALERV